MPIPSPFSGRSKAPRRSVLSYIMSSTNSVVISPLSRSRSSSDGSSSLITVEPNASGSITSGDHEARSQLRSSKPVGTAISLDECPFTTTAKPNALDESRTATPAPSETSTLRTESPSQSIADSTFPGAVTKPVREPTPMAEPLLPALKTYLPPPESAIKIAVSIGNIAGAIAPVPWLGLVVNIVDNIFQLCQNVSKNRHGVNGLADHCSALLDTLRENHANSDPTTLDKMRSELESLLTNIRDKMEEWGRLDWFGAFVQQDTISKAISLFHSEIDSLCNRHILAVHMEIINWQEKHNEQSKRDREDVMAFLSDIKSVHVLESKCRKEEIGALREEFAAFFDFVQKLLLESRRGSVQVESSDQCESLENNFSAIYRVSGMPPPGMELTKGLTQMKQFPEYGNSGVFDIYRGTCFNDVNVQCAFKVVRHASLNERTRRRFDRQLKHWQWVNKLAVDAQTKRQKIYILPLIGAIHSENRPYPFLCFISPWMERGNAVDYVKKNEDTDRISLIRKIALGLEVLHKHDPPLAHGYIRGSNILIDDMCDPLLSDFGLMRVVEDANAGSMAPSSLPTAPSSYRWLAPELLGLVGVGKRGINEDKLGNVLTTKSDIFMFGMTILELMTGEQPHSDLKYDNQVIIRRHEGENPNKPDGSEWEKVYERGLNERLWGFLERCWAEDPADRPTITEVLEFLPEST
ncbi:hypothetical protein M0805_009705 [Coniferiporia weirii]|nr:hypothetical protein M0805_009705 [Coniferiporia weirii]